MREREREDQDKVDGVAGEVLRLHVDVEGDSGVVPAQGSECTAISCS